MSNSEEVVRLKDELQKLRAAQKEHEEEMKRVQKEMETLRERAKYKEDEREQNEEASRLNVDSLVDLMINFDPLPFTAISDDTRTVRPLCHRKQNETKFKFQDKNRDFEALRKELTNILQLLRRRKRLEKMDFSIPLLHAAPGTGKSRSLDEIAGRIDVWLQDVPRVEQFQFVSIPYPISFGNGTGYAPEFSGNDSMTGRSRPTLGSCPKVAPHIATRMLHSHVSTRGDEFDTFTKAFIQRFGERGFFKLNLEIVLQCMERLYVRELKQKQQQEEVEEETNTNLLFVHTILLDEYNKNIFETWSSMDAFVKQTLKRVGAGIMERTSFNETRALWSVIAGTEGIPLQDASSNSSFSIEEVRFPPLLSEDEVVSIIDDLVTRTGDATPENLQDWRRWIEFRATLRKVAGHPRVLEVFMKGIFQHEHRKGITATELNGILSRACSIVSIKKDPETAMQAFRVTMFGGRYNSTIRDELQKYSLITEDKYDTPSIPFALLHRVAEIMNKTAKFVHLTKLASEPIISTNMYGLVWEELCQRIFAFRLAAYVLSHPGEEIKLGKLFHGALMNSMTERISVSANDDAIISTENADSHVLKNQVHAAAPEYLSEVTCGTTWRNASGASAGDLLSRLSDLLVQVQCKFADQNNNSWDYEDLVREEHINKNKELVDAWNRKYPHDRLRGVTMFMVGAPVKKHPE